MSVEGRRRPLHNGPGGRRYIALGQADAGRLLTVVFTVRSAKVRVISARAMSKPERKLYGQVQAQHEAPPDVQE